MQVYFIGTCRGQQAVIANPGAAFQLWPVRFNKNPLILHLSHLQPYFCRGQPALCRVRRLEAQVHHRGERTPTIATDTTVKRRKTNRYPGAWFYPTLFFLAIWLLAFRWRGDATLLPGPAQVGAAFLGLWRNGVFVPDLLASLGRVCPGFLLAAALGLPLGLLCGRSRRVAAYTGNAMDFLRQIPPVALVPLLILWLGLGELPKLLVIFYASFFPILLAAELGAGQVDPKLLEMARLYHHGRGEVWRSVILPSALPSILAGLRLGLGYGWRSLVVAEMLAADKGLGALIVGARAFSRVDRMFVGVLAIGLAGLLLDFALKYLARLVPWQAPGGVQP